MFNKCQKNDSDFINILFKNKEAFLLNKKKDNLNDTTLEKYSQIIEKFIIYLKSKGVDSLYKINREVLIDFVNYLLASMVSDSIYTRKIVINTVKMFIKYLFEQKGCNDLYVQFQNIKIFTPEVFPNFYGNETIEKILKTIELILKAYKIEEGITKPQKDFLSYNVTPPKDEVEKEIMENEDVFKIDKNKNDFKKEDKKTNKCLCYQIKNDYAFFEMNENKNKNDFELIKKRRSEDVFDFEKMKENKEVFYRLRNAITLSLLVHCGVKLEELRDTRLCDISISKGKRFYHVRVSRRRRGERVIPVKRGMLDEVFKSYCVISRGEFICSTFNGRKMDRREIINSIENFFNENELTYIGVQGFRHSYAKRLVENGYSKLRVKELMGYRNITPVNRYFELFSRD